MVDALVFLTYLSVILLLGILTSALSQKLRIPNILLLLLIGIVLGKVAYNNKPIVAFPEVFLVCTSIIALVMIIFDSASRFSLKRLDNYAFKITWLSLLFLILNMLLLSMATNELFEVESLVYVFVFAGLMSGTDPAAILTMLRSSSHRVFEILKFESLINTPIVVLIPFIVVDFSSSITNGSIITSIIDYSIPLLQQVIVGLGAGIFMGILVFKIMRNWYSDVLSPLAVITAALLAYIIAENFHGNGVLAVTAMGLVFGYSKVKEKEVLQEFSSIFSYSLEILVFVLVGFVVSFPIDTAFILKSIALFCIYLAIRFVAVSLSLMKLGLSLKEKIFIILNVQKGIAVAVVVFSFASLGLAGNGSSTILHLSILFMLYSIILSTVVVKLSHYFINVEPKKDLKKLVPKTAK